MKRLISSRQTSHWRSPRRRTVTRASQCFIPINGQDKRPIWCCLCQKHNDNSNWQESEKTGPQIQWQWWQCQACHWASVFNSQQKCMKQVQRLTKHLVTTSQKFKQDEQPEWGRNNDNGNSVTASMMMFHQEWTICNELERGPHWKDPKNMHLNPPQRQCNEHVIQSNQMAAGLA